MKPVHKGMLATFFGVLFGSLVALALQQVWMLGALIGGIASAGISAYILFNAKEFLVAIPMAWSKAIHWRPSKETIALFQFFGPFLSIGCVSALSWLPVILLNSSVTGTVFIFMVTGMSIVSFFGFISQYSAGREFLLTRETEKIIWRDLGKLLIWLSPLVVFAILYYVPAMFRLIFQTALQVVGRFAKELFILVHCRDRAMCMVDSSLGMVVAFLVQQQFLGGGPLLSVGSILVGGLAGTVLYFFNREVVAIRWLKVQPNGSHA
ncbi:MAG: hypothetical protein AAB549_02275 [Patescibacteria group bacterium]